MTIRIMLLVLVVVLTCGTGCAKSDWIQQTLVMVDVTETWRTTEGGRFELDLEQQGSRVKGPCDWRGYQA